MSRGQRRAPVDYVFWGRLDEWKLEETAALLLDVDPRSLSSETLDGGDESLTRKRAEIRELIERAYKINHLQNHTHPNFILEWARLKGFDIPEGLLQAVRRYGGPIGEFRERNRALEDKVKSLEEVIVRLQDTAKASADEEKPLTEPGRRVAKTIIVTLAAFGYDYRPGAPIAPQIARDAGRLGLSVDDATVLKWLGAAAQLVPEGGWENLPKPKSARK